jgi:WS/DGAT/MGAT family acyltransferase
MTSAYERLPERDAAFLIFETPETHMHLGGTAIFEAGPLATAQGGVDIARIRAFVGSRLHLIPRYRQRLAWIPVESYPVWIDDDHFNLAYHVRHTSLPRPGDEAQLKQLAARVMSQPLDRRRPLWEAWIVEGLAGGRFAMLTKIHHCMADGISAVDLVTVLLSTTRDDAIEAAVPWEPRPAPGRLQLSRDEFVRRTTAPFVLARRLAGVVRDPAPARAALTERLGAIWQTITAGLPTPSETPLNRPVGPHRRVDWLTLDLAEAKAIKNRLGGTVNDVILTTVAGGMRRFLNGRGVAVERVTYRVVVPVSVREAGEPSAPTNRASGWLLPLPVDEPDPRRRHQRVCQLTALRKATKQALGPDALLGVVELAGPVVLSLGVRLTSRLAPYNLLITNVPGPPLPLYLLGARMLAGYPVAPLFEHQGLAVAILSNDGRLCVGLNADWDLVPDVAAVVADLAASFTELREAAMGEAPASAATRASG